MINFVINLDFLGVFKHILKNIFQPKVDKGSFLLIVFARPRGYKTFFVLNSIVHEIINAHKYKNIKKFGFFRFR